MHPAAYLCLFLLEPKSDYVKNFVYGNLVYFVKALIEVFRKELLLVGLAPLERDPLGLLKGAASIYRAYYKSGHRTYERAGERKVILRTFDSETFSRADCLTVVGWHERVIGMCGGKNARVEETLCRARGDAVCEYVCEWD